MVQYTMYTVLAYSRENQLQSVTTNGPDRGYQLKYAFCGGIIRWAKQLQKWSSIWSMEEKSSGD